MGAMANANPVPSMPVAEEVRVISPVIIWATTSTDIDAPGSRLPSEQFRVVIPCPPVSHGDGYCEHLPVLRERHDVGAYNKYRH